MKPVMKPVTVSSRPSRTETPRITAVVGGLALLLGQGVVVRLDGGAHLRAHHDTDDAGHERGNAQAAKAADKDRDHGQHDVDGQVIGRVRSVGDGRLAGVLLLPGVRIRRGRGRNGRLLPGVLRGRVRSGVVRGRVVRSRIGACRLHRSAAGRAEGRVVFQLGTTVGTKHDESSFFFDRSGNCKRGERLLKCNWIPWQRRACRTAR